LTGLSALIVATPALAAPSERRIRDWPRMSIGLSGNNVAYATSTATTIALGGRYTIFRTDTYRLPLAGARLTGARIDGMVLRTSAGRTTAGPIFGDRTGRFGIVATGQNFPPQVVFCCLADKRDLPVEADGRAGGPVTVAAALDGPLLRYILRDPAGGHRLVSYTVSEEPGQPFTQRVSRPIDAQPSGSLIAMAPGIIAWVDRRNTAEVRLATTPSGQFEAFGDLTIPQSGTVVRLHVTRTMVVTLVRRSSGYQLIRFDAPSWTPTVVWSGSKPPPYTAAGDRTVALVNGAVVQQHVPGRARRTVLRLRGTIAALATDGRRIAVLERLRTRARARVIRQSAIVVVPVVGPPGAYTAELS
jgi:hypothetical protein